MRTILQLVTLLTVLSTTAAVAVAPDPFSAHYDVSFSGLKGEIVSTLTRNDAGKMVFENRTSARGIARLARPHDAVERSEFLVKDGALVPVHFNSEDGSRRNKRGNEIRFDWTHKIAESDYEDETRSLNLETGILDRQLLQLAMMVDLADGVTEARYVVVDRHDIKDYEMIVLGEETVTVEAGNFETLKVLRKRPGSSRTIIMWCAAKLDYLPVRMEQLKNDKVVATLEMTAIE